ncbi:MAG TPA: aminotransferase class V-fold PLP-dependent enzyme [Longimicrobiales bacterium]
MKRRNFLHTLAAGAVLPHLELPLDKDDWKSVRKQFLIPRDRIYLNVGTLGAQPRPVVDAVMDVTRRTAQSFPPGVKWPEINQKVASLLDCDADGLAFPRNTTEAMNFVANGLDLAAGDHVVTTNHEHIGGLCCWQLVAKRRQVALTQVDLTPAPHDPQQVFQQVTAAVTRHTKVISVSHVNFTTGLIMPVRELSRWARERGIIFVIDGAHPPGLMRISIRDIDPDFYASSPHKWLLAPQGTGMLYMRAPWRTKLWPTEASGDWDNLTLGALRFNHLGTIDESRYAGLLAALDFHNLIGPERGYARIEELRQHLIARLRENPRVHIVSPTDSRGAGMVSFKMDGIEALELQKKLAEKNVRTRVIGEYDYGYMRLSPHVYNSDAEIDRVARLMAAN